MSGSSCRPARASRDWLRPCAFNERVRPRAPHLSCSLTQASRRKLTFKTAQHMGKRDMIEYLRKVYDVKALKARLLRPLALLCGHS